MVQLPNILQFNIALNETFVFFCSQSTTLELTHYKFLALFQHIFKLLIVFIVDDEVVQCFKTIDDFYI